MKQGTQIPDEQFTTSLNMGMVKYGYGGGMMIGEKIRQAWIKRTADWLEKMSVASMAVGVFQESEFGLFLGLACYIGSLYLTWKIGGK